MDEFIQIAETAFWKGYFEHERRLSKGKPGEFYQNLPEEVKNRLSKLKSVDFQNVRFDAISWML